MKMKLNKLASMAAFILILAQMMTITFATVDLTGYYSFNWLELPEQWLMPMMYVTITLGTINIIKTLIAMFKINNDLKILSVWLAIISIAVTWYPYFFPAIIIFPAAVLLLAGKYQPISMAY